MDTYTTDGIILDLSTSDYLFVEGKIDDTSKLSPKTTKLYIKACYATFYVPTHVLTLQIEDSSILQYLYLSPTIVRIIIRNPISILTLIKYINPGIQELEFTWKNEDSLEVSKTTLSIEFRYLSIFKQLRKLIVRNIPIVDLSLLNLPQLDKLLLYNTKTLLIQGKLDSKLSFLSICAEELNLDFIIKCEHTRLYGKITEQSKINFQDSIGELVCENNDKIYYRQNITPDIPLNLPTISYLSSDMETVI